jgi:GPI-anchor transamidase subunit K
MLILASVFIWIIRPASCDTWVILVDTSRYFYNYRHSVNALAMNDMFRKLGVPENQIILLLADYPALNSRNRYPGRMYFQRDRDISVSGPDVEVSSAFVSTASFLEILTQSDRLLSTGTSTGSSLLKSNHESNIVLYMTGHGGDEFMKFNDIDELGAVEFAKAIEEMYHKNMYKNMLIMIDTCQAATLTQYITAPNVVSITSSRQGENSYALQSDSVIGVSTIDRFTAATVKFLSKFYDSRTAAASSSSSSRTDDSYSLMHMYQSYKPQDLHSHAVLHMHNLSKPLSNLKLIEFFPTTTALTKHYFTWKRINPTHVVVGAAVTSKLHCENHQIRGSLFADKENDFAGIVHKLDEIHISDESMMTKSSQWSKIGNYIKKQSNELLFLVAICTLLFFIPFL